VKTHFETGFGAFSGRLPTLTKEMIAAIITASHREKLSVLMRANSYEAHQFATQAGVDIVVHCLWNWGDYDNAEKIPPPSPFRFHGAAMPASGAVLGAA
jgi:hypothetical protein